MKSAWTERHRCALTVVATLLVFAFFPPMLSAEPLYVVEEARGIVTFTNRKPPAGARYRMVTANVPTYSGIRSRRRYRYRPRVSKYDRLIASTAERHRLEPALVKAVVHVESAFRPRARSPKGAMGLMQLMPQTARELGVDNPYRPGENVSGGTRYLRMLYDRYRGNMRLALAAYNAGPKIVDQLGRVPPYAETQSYVKRVMRYTEIYRCVNAGRKNCYS